MSLRVRGSLTRHDGFTLALDLDVPTPGVTAIIGSSGSGKSTLLRCIAGLLPSPGMSVTLDGERWQDGRHTLPAHRRPVSLVMQEGALFPHLSVLGNLRFPDRRRDGFALDVPRAVARFGLEALLQRRPDTLSGGQRQRVALARALVTPARLWLLDEPLSALDGPARRELAPELARLCRELDVPVLYVSHSLAEVLPVADHLVVLERGRVVASGSPAEVGARLDHPVSDQIDVGGILRCRFERYHAAHDLSELRVADAPLWVRGDLSDLAPEPRVQIPALAISLAAELQRQTSVLNQLPVRVTAVGDAVAGSVTVSLDCAGQTLLARITALSVERLQLRPGQSMFALIKSVALDVRQS